MILVAFVLVLVATVMLIIGTFFDGGVAYIWISIGACVATFGVLAASYFARRRGADDEGARPQPLGAGESRPAAIGSGPRGTTVPSGTVPSGGTATRTREEPDTDAEEVADGAEADEPTVTIVPSEEDRQPVDEQDEGVTEDEASPAAEEAPEPAPRRVAPRRVVRRADAAAQPAAAAAPTADSGTDAAQDQPTWPSGAAGSDESATDDADEAAEVAAPAATGGTRKVVRRAQSGEGGTSSGGTRKVVRRVQPGSGSGGSGGTRKVVRRAGAAQAGGQRTVKRVVRRAPSGDATPGASGETSKPATRSGGTRGKKARAVLSEIKGVGPAKQDALLKRFGSLEDMAEASISDLAEVKGVGESVAQAIKDSLQDR